MRYIPSQVVSVLNRVQRRLSQARPGSVLILVVVLVVLLALMGTALLSTTRNDRYVSSQNTANVQIDLLVDGVVQIVKSAIADDLSGIPNTGANTTSRTYRPAWDSGTIASSQQYINAYNNWDMPNLKRDDSLQNYVAADHPQDKWLAPRLPTLPDSGGKPLRVFWPSISMLPGVAKFDAPFSCGTITRSIDLTLPTTYTDHFTSGSVWLSPNFVQPRGYSQTFPAWFLPSVNGFILAADADGDGIADAGYVKIPVGELDGLTYYYAVRIIDNNSAVNVNTAWSRVADFQMPGSGTITAVDAFGNTIQNANTDNNLGMFRSHVGFYELMHPNPTVTTPDSNLKNQAENEIGWLNSYRFNAAVATMGFADSALIAKEGSGTRSDFTYITQGDFLEHTLARRLDNAGTRVDLSTALVPMKPFGVSDAAALAYHFTLSSLDTSAGIENAFNQSNSGPLSVNPPIPDSVHQGAANFADPAKDNRSPARNRRGYRANEVGDWVYDNFNWSNWTPQTFGLQYNNATVTTGRTTAAGYRSPLRSILTTYNPVSMLMPQRELTIPVVQPPMPDYGAKYTVTAPSVRRLGTKTNINTAKFEELWRAFWCVMAANDGESPFTNAQSGGVDNGMGNGFAQDNNFAPDATSNPQRMFRSSIRDAKGALNPTKLLGKDMVQLRSAAAAVQAMQMRQLPDLNKGKKPYARTDIRTEVGYQLKMFGTTPQPFITEVYVWYDAKSKDPTGQHTNVAPYIAIELFNPFDYDIDISNLKIKYWHREAGMPTKTLMDTGITLSGGLIKRHGFAVIDNYGGGENDEVQYYPPSSKLFGEPSGLAQGSSYFSRPNDLDPVLDNEMVITRIRPGEIDEQPVDSFDFSGFPSKDTGDTTQACAWHYVRRTTGGDQGNGIWGCVYPGRYDLDATKGQDPTKPRQQGTEFVQWEAGTTDPWDGAGPTKAQVTLGADNDPDVTKSSAHEFIIPLPDKGSPGPNALEGTTRKFPFGMFARDGDILQVPFIASYSVSDPTGKLVEMNSISMDAAFAEDTDVDDDVPAAAGTSTVREQIGHFCPIMMDTPGGKIDDYNDNQTDLTIPLQRYAWARRLFDYLTVQSPASDYTPDVSPDLYTAAGGTRPDPVKNSSPNAAEEDGLIDSPGNVTSNPPGNEDAVPVQGLININTAPWIVLSAIPWVAGGQDKFSFDEAHHFLATGNQIDDNIDIAKAIEYWRDGDGSQNVPAYGPFRSIFDLYKVEDGTRQFRIFDFIQKTLYQSTEPGYTDGEFSSYLGGTDTSTKDGVRWDFKEQYLLMNKVSNLITTRSDSFTVYILVQGWRGVGGNHPELVVQRRVAFIQDRSPITSVNTVLPSSVNVPTD